LAVVHRNDTPADDLTNDVHDYHRIAVSLAEHGRYGSTGTDIYRAPAYPFFVAAVYAVFGPKAFAVYVVQAFLLALTFAYAFRIFSFVSGSRQLSLVALGLCALWPFFYRDAATLMTESFSAFLISAMLWHLLVSIRTPNMRNCITAGILLGIVCLTKGASLPFVPVAALFVAFAGPRSSKRMVLGLLFLGCSALTILPWTVRNYRVTGHVVVVSTGYGAVLAEGNWPHYYEADWPWLKFPEDWNRQLRGRSPLEQDRILARIGQGYITENPGRAAIIFVRKFSELWLSNLGANPAAKKFERGFVVAGFSVPYAAILFVPLLVLAFIGWFALDSQGRGRFSPILAFALTWTAAYVWTIAQRRYVIPIQFYEIFLAVVGARHMYLKFAARPRAGQIQSS